jgi:nucleoside-diphosphate-sugar epimerase
MGKKKFLVKGATGATGVHMVDQLLACSDQVRALAHREDDRSKRLQGLGAEVVIGDLLRKSQRSPIVYSVCKLPISCECRYLRRVDWPNRQCAFKGALPSSRS